MLASAFFFFSTVSFAQYKNFEISKYKLPEMKRHQLDFNFSSNGDLHSMFSDNIIYYNGEFFKRKGIEFRSNLDSKYSYYINTKRIQATAGLAFSSAFSFEKDSGWHLKNRKEQIFGGGFEGTSDVKFFRSKNWFAELSPSLYM